MLDGQYQRLMSMGENMHTRAELITMANECLDRSGKHRQQMEQADADLEAVGCLIQQAGFDVHEIISACYE